MRQRYLGHCQGAAAEEMGSGNRDSVCVWLVLLKMWNPKEVYLSGRRRCGFEVSGKGDAFGWGTDTRGLNVCKGGHLTLVIFSSVCVVLLVAMEGFSKLTANLGQKVRPDFCFGGAQRSVSDRYHTATKFRIYEDLQLTDSLKMFWLTRDFVCKADDDVSISKSPDP
ncbi:hypothetical protein TNCV_1407641 [Trichonephila clavipes]|nr:hypothetical protein TNCV_1407641 [Trichonephila clavipes]